MVIGFVVSLSIASILIFCFTHSRKQYVDFSEIFYGMVEGNFEGVDLTIYYMSPNTSTRYPLSVDDLLYGGTVPNEKRKKKDEINGSFEYKIFINGHKLEECIDLYRELKDFAIVPAEDETYVNAQIHYMFEIKKERKIFSVTMWGGGPENRMFVNEVEIEGNDIFIEIIIPFLPEIAAKEMSEYLGK